MQDSSSCYTFLLRAAVAGFNLLHMTNTTTKTVTEEAHDMTRTCGAARGAHWTAHSLACRCNRDLVNVQRRAKEGK